MDHIPYPNLDVPPIVVPYLAGFEYDHEDFATFPERVGFWKDGNLDLDRPCRQLAALAQAWLLFGLIDAFALQRLDKGVFVRKEDGNGADEGVIDTTRLGDIIAGSAKRLQKRFLRSKLLKDIRARLMEAARASSALDQIQAEDPPSAAVFLSIKILIIYLSEMFDAAFWLDLGSNIPTVPLRDSFRLGMLGRDRNRSDVPIAVRLLTDRMRRSGWCIHQIMEVCRAHNYCVVYYYSSIVRAESWPDITHETCTEAQCVAYNIKDDSAYKMRHVEDCLGCELVGPPEDEVADIVRDGGIPLVELNSTLLHNQSVLEVAPATQNTQYTAISHVWIDGHGNPTANTLPRCQLQRLAQGG
ncbi:hypothetical protein SLS58_010022 [Diplodia intermedia]|uniref:Uncharacterized protein n=1 Tax=Diplodia intermedia TaxID=856260 RepID=A0ABR3T975_9PEZI